MKKIKQWKFSRYAQYVKYGNFVKFYNLFKSLYYWKIGKLDISTKPSFLRVEISLMCNMNCPLCFVKKENTFYSLDCYRKLIDKLKAYAFVISLYEIGEPLENKKIVEYISYANRNNVGTIISTHLSFDRSDEFWEKLVLSGLDRVIVAIDGITDKVYNKYRRNGDLNLVLSNLSKIIRLKKRLNSHLKVEWQMIDFGWNRSEQAEAKRLAYKMGCDEFRLIQEVTKTRLKYNKTNFVRKKNCALPYFSFNVTANNLVRPCTKIYNDDVVIGNLNESTFEEVWNGSEIKRVRCNKQIKDKVGCRTCHE